MYLFQSVFIAQIIKINHYYYFNIKMLYNTKSNSLGWVNVAGSSETCTKPCQVAGLQVRCIHVCR